MDGLFNNLMKDAPALGLLGIFVYVIFRYFMKAQQIYFRELKDYREGREKIIDRLIQMNEEIALKFAETTSNHLSANTQAMVGLEHAIKENCQMVTQLRELILFNFKRSKGGEQE